jgi:vacuolar-type H+-ATPase subunit E/Vma4
MNTGYGAPFGKNLESACIAYARREAERKERESRDAYLKKMEDAWEDYLRHFEETGEGR